MRAMNSVLVVMQILHYILTIMVGISFYSEVYNCNQTKEGEMNMKKKILLGLVLILCCFTGCSSNSSKNRDDNNPPEIKMSDIDWSVKSRIIDDERKLTFSYKNNTDYTIAYIELTFTRKDMVLDDSNSDINIYQWSSNDMAKKTAKPIAMIMLIFRLMDMGLVVDNLKHM